MGTKYSLRMDKLSGRKKKLLPFVHYTRIN